MNNVYKGTAIYLLFFTFMISGSAVYASHEIDDIEKSLSKEIVSKVEIKLRNPLLQADKGYAYFLLAAYKHDPLARDNAEKIYKELGTPASQAFLGSIELLRARDLKSGGIFGGLMDLFKKQGYVQSGIKSMDRAADDNPENLDVRIVRAITYFELPSFFGKFTTGFRDIETILNWMQEGKVSVPDSEMFFRDKSSIYYYAGRYFLKMNQSDKAKEMFSKSSKFPDQTPFGCASRKRLAHLT